jgi:hypothetical protein
MSGYSPEPTLDEILSDPIVTALMQADSVDPRQLDRMLKRIAEELTHDDRDTRGGGVLTGTGAAAGMERSAFRECRCEMR